MSLEVMVDVRCDRCGETADDLWGTGALARKSARASGWATGLPGGRDLCPNCRPHPRGQGADE